MRGLKASLVAISADDAETVRKTVSSLRLTYTVLPDPEHKVIKGYGVLHPEEGISRPATFIIDGGGLVRFRHIGKNVADRPNPALLLNILRLL